MKNTLALFADKRLGVMILALFLSVCSAYAAKAQEHTEKPADKVYELAPVTVTAQKREENVQKVPMGISVFTGDRIEESGAKDTKELLRSSPNVFVKDSGSYYQTTIRGVSGFILSTQSAAGYYVDDISLPAVFMQNPELLDVERVEVLKGPQGTLYGRNSESGVINIITRQPDNTLRGKIFNEVSFYDTSHGYEPGNKLGGTISGPIVEDKLFLGLAGSWNYTNGFTKNLYDDDDKARKVNDQNGRMTLRWTPVETWDVSLINDAMNADNNFALGRYVDGPAKTRRNTADHDAQHYRDYTGNSQSLRVQHKGPSVDFLSITGRRYYDETMKNDGDLTRQFIREGHMKEEDTSWSQELRLASPSGKDNGPFKWLVGSYAFKEDLDIYSAFDNNMPPYPRFLDARNTDVSYKGYAMFAQGTYTLFDKLHLTAGLRYDHTDLEGNQRYRNTMMGTDLRYGASSADDEVLPKVSVAYDITDTVMGYATVSKGYLSGGYDYATASSKEGFAYDPEYSWNYEVGLKTSWLDNKLSANLALFYIDMTDKQVSEMDATGLAMVMSNAGKAHSMGAELELTARPLQGLELFGGLGVTRAKIDEWKAFDGASEYDYKGKYLPNVPRTTYNAGVQYTHTSGFWGRAEVVGTGKFYHDAKNEITESAYDLVNLRLGYTGDMFDVTLWCKNLFDKEYNNVRFAYPGIGMAVFEGDPRQIGLTVAYKF